MVLVNAVRAFEAAAQLAREVDDPELYAAAVLGLSASGSPMAGEIDKYRPLIVDAIDWLGDRSLALKIALRCRLLVFTGTTSASAEQADEILAAARSLGDRSTLCIALEAVTRATDTPDRAVSRIQAARELESLASDLGNPELCSKVLHTQVRDHLQIGQMNEAIAAADRYRDLQPESVFRDYFHQMAVMFAVLRGQLPEAEHHFGLVVHRDGGSAQTAAVQLFGIRRLQGRLTELKEAVTKPFERRPTVPAIAARFALFHAIAGEKQRSEEVYRGLVSDLSRIPRDPSWISTILALTETCIFLDDDIAAESLLAELAPYRGGHLSLRSVFYFGACELFSGMLLRVLKRNQEAEHNLRVAVSMHGEIGAVPALARSLAELGWTMLTGEESRPEEADRLLGRASGLCRRCAIADITKAVAA